MFVSFLLLTSIHNIYLNNIQSATSSLLLAMSKNRPAHLAVSGKMKEGGGRSGPYNSTLDHVSELLSVVPREEYVLFKQLSHVHRSDQFITGTG